MRIKRKKLKSKFESIVKAREALGDIIPIEVLSNIIDNIFY